MTLYKELLLLRHGKSDWNTDTTDFNRPLNKRGERNAQQMAEWMEEQQLIPDLVISSPAVRALTTAEIVCKTLDLAFDSLQLDKCIYEASLPNLKQVLSQTSNSVHRLLLVGHNPGFEYLVRNLSPDIPMAKNGNLMPTASLAYLQLDMQWSTLYGQSWIQRPKDLPSK